MNFFSLSCCVPGPACAVRQYINRLDVRLKNQPTQFFDLLLVDMLQLIQFFKLKIDTVTIDKEKSIQAEVCWFAPPLDKIIGVHENVENLEKIHEKYDRRIKRFWNTLDKCDNVCFVRYYAPGFEMSENREQIMEFLQTMPHQLILISVFANEQQKEEHEKMFIGIDRLKTFFVCSDLDIFKTFCNDAFELEKASHTKQVYEFISNKMPLFFV